LLDQLFFIGDGLTGTGTGMVQQFVVPSGATALYFAAADSLGSSSGNPGTINVESSDLSAVPEPSTLGMLGAGLAGALTLARRKRR
jgi:hypothetical protein